MSELNLSLLIVVLLGLHSECHALSYKDLIEEYNKFTNTLEACEEFSSAKVMHKLLPNDFSNVELRKYLLQKTPECLYKELLGWMETCKDRSPLALGLLLSQPVLYVAKNTLIELAPYIKGFDDTAKLHLPSNEGLYSTYLDINTKEQLCEEFLEGKSAIKLLKKENPTKLSALIGEDWKHKYVTEFKKFEKKCQSESAFDDSEMEEGRHWLTSVTTELMGFEEYVRS